MGTKVPGNERSREESSLVRKFQLPHAAVLHRDHPAADNGCSYTTTFPSAGDGHAWHGEKQN